MKRLYIFHIINLNFLFIQQLIQLCLKILNKNEFKIFLLIIYKHLNELNTQKIFQETFFH